MTPDRFLEARILIGPDQAGGPTVQLSSDGRDFGEPLDGAILERQLQLPNGRFLLFLTDDCPYEETLRIVLMSSDGDLLDGLELGGDYATGALQHLAVVSDSVVEFDFVHRRRCQLHVRNEPRYLAPPRWLPGVRRTCNTLARYLDLKWVN